VQPNLPILENSCVQLVNFHRPDRPPQPGVLRADGGVVDLVQSNPELPTSMEALLAAGPEALAAASATAARADAVVVREARLRAPLTRPPKILCVGLNYRDHAKETGAAVPAEPVIFNKLPGTLIGPGDDIRLPSESSEVDYEAELVVVIGKAGRRIPAERASEHIAGYTLGNDVSARDWQKNKPGKQWLLGKSFDTFAPLGPALVTRDEIPDPHALGIRFLLNGRIMQESNTGDLIFRLPELIAYISQVTTLLPGDLLFTGTPAGVGVARQPPVFLKPGDVCRVEIDGLGALENRCTAG
jgi:2-keto-4-pentenoate hydratase/2-oxohepta-3-ene-1,7-dioic acid hydratase in catechol pathway